MLLVPRPLRASDDGAAVDPQLLARVLTPYKPHCRYLRTAAVRYAGAKPIAVASGTFSIPESCYIASTGHFNAVEFNICYNQLAYVLFAGCINAGVMGKVRAVQGAGIPTMAEFKNDQLPAMMIVALESRYFKPLDSKDFTAEL